ncbi:hypothetical protein VTK56DRAFT_8212 [Thermocarpiscus australiensis]
MLQFGRVLAVSRPLAQPTWQRLLQRQAIVRHLKTQPDTEVETHSITEAKAQPLRRPFVMYMRRLVDRTMPGFVPRVHAGKHKYTMLGRKALDKYTRRTRRHWARKTRRLRLRARKKREQIQPYQVSRLVLDLDALGRPGVRPYGKQDEIEQTARWQRDPERDALFQRMVHVKKEIEASKARWHAPLSPHDPRRITERDILATVLLGTLSYTRPDDDRQAAEREPALGYVSRDVLGSIGITARIAEDVHHTVHMLLHRLRHQPKQQFGIQSANEFREALARTDSLVDVQRQVAPLLQTPEGRTLLSECQGEIITACTRKISSLSDAHAWRVHLFLNNLALGLAADGLHFDLSSEAVQPLKSRIGSGTAIASSVPDRLTHP